MADAPPPSLRLRIDSDALAHNWRELDRVSEVAQAGAAVKADCYGLGAGTCVPVLRDAGAQYFFVAHWSEVAAVAHHVPAHSISVLHGPLSDADVAFAYSSGAIPTINSLEQAKRWLNAGGGDCDLMVDTGINRLGLSMRDIGNELIGQLDVRILMSHLACADEDSAMNARQLAAFQAAADAIPHKKASLANSAGIALGNDYHFDITRPGLSLYGGCQREELSGLIRQVAFPEAAIMQTREIEARESVGYNAKFTAQKPMRIGVVALGYADGYLQSWKDKGTLTSEDRVLPVLGKVSMDMIVIDLENAPELREGDWVSVPYSLPEASHISGLPQYELLTLLGQRLKS